MSDDDKLPDPTPEQLKRAMEETTEDKINAFAEAHTVSEWVALVIGALILGGCLIRWCMGF